MTQQPQRRTDHYPPFEIIEKDGRLALAIPHHNHDVSRVFARLGHDMIRLSFNSMFLADLKPIGIEHMRQFEKYPTIAIVEKTDDGRDVRSYEAIIAAVKE